MKKLKIPKFRDEAREREFWSKVDLSTYFGPKNFKPVSFPSLKPTTTSISLRMPNYILARLKERANALNVPYQTLMKQYIAKEVLERRR
jgi:predicted DNA binding CopG/RHH family protein